MKKTIIITASISLLLGIVLTVTSYFVYTVIQIKKQTIINTQDISKIVEYLNKVTATTK